MLSAGVCEVFSLRFKREGSSPWDLSSSGELILCWHEATWQKRACELIWSLSSRLLTFTHHKGTKLFSDSLWVWCLKSLACVWGDVSALYRVMTWSFFTPVTWCGFGQDCNQEMGHVWIQTRSPGSIVALMALMTLCLKKQTPQVWYNPGPLGSESYFLELSHGASAFLFSH